MMSPWSVLKKKHLGHGFLDLSNSPGGLPELGFDLGHLVVKRGPVKGNIGGFVKMPRLASRSFKGDCSRWIQLVGQAVESAYHGAEGIYQAAAVLVEGADYLQ